MSKTKLYMSEKSDPPSTPKNLNILISGVSVMYPKKYKVDYREGGVHYQRLDG